MLLSKLIEKLLNIIEKYKWLIILFFVVLIAIVYSLFNPYEEEFLPKCAFYSLTGYKCPGCGSQRAIYNLLHFNFLSAAKENLLMVFSLPYIFIGALFDLFKPQKRALKKIQEKLFGLTAVWIVFIVILLYWIIRNFPFYEDFVSRFI